VNISTDRLEELMRQAQEALSNSIITDEGLNHARFKVEELIACLHLVMGQAVEAARGDPQKTIAVLKTALELSSTLLARLRLIDEVVANRQRQASLVGFGEDQLVV